MEIRARKSTRSTHKLVDGFQTFLRDRLVSVNETITRLIKKSEQIGLKSRKQIPVHLQEKKCAQEDLDKVNKRIEQLKSDTSTSSELTELESKLMEQLLECRQSMVALLAKLDEMLLREQTAIRDSDEFINQSEQIRLEFNMAVIRRSVDYGSRFTVHQ